ncbi:DMT family transporter [uncultured Brachyspira sp.]|uniref:DMT family transporter n=1 Tax=uncultured Brachyspira sp. TaxID=221953 RepID=UPI0025CBCEBA|nr:DMT family transporter [uncultured Brachyspira sp.]
MYYIIMFIATTIFASIAWVANYSKNAGWSLFFLASISYFIAFCVFALLCILKKKPMFDAGMWKDGLKPVIILLVGNMSLNVAVSMTTPEKIGFLVGLTVIIVPILDFFMYKAKIPKLIYPSLIFAFIGNFILNYNKEMKIFSFGLGEFLSLATTVCYALSIIWIGRCARSFGFESFGFIQSLVSSIGYLIASLITGSIHSISNLPLYPILFYGLGSYVLGNACQFVAQKNLSPIISALIMATQPIVGVIIGILFFNFSITISICISGFFFFIASVMGVIANNNTSKQ